LLSQGERLGDQVVQSGMWGGEQGCLNGTGRIQFLVVNNEGVSKSVCEYVGEFAEGARKGAGELTFGGKKYIGRWNDDAAAVSAIPMSIGPTFYTGTCPPRSFWSRDPLKPKESLKSDEATRLRARVEEAVREVDAVKLQVVSRHILVAGFIIVTI
jgi:hypothetical protein